MMGSRVSEEEVPDLELSKKKGVETDDHFDGKNEIEPGTTHTLFNKFIWHGGSVYDAWLNASSAQVGQVILSMPYSYAQMGLKYGIVIHLLYAITGIWTAYMLARLYVEYRYREEKKGRKFNKHVIQYHEVIGALVGPWAQYVVLFFNVMTMGSLATVQIIACASNAYYISDSLDKRQWALIFGAVSMLTVLLPTLHNFRMFSFIGILTTTYTAWYLLIATLSGGKDKTATHTGPHGLVQFFTGTTNILFATGGHSVTVEIMHAMWRPRKFKYVYVWTCAYVLTITLPHCIALNWAFGDLLLQHANALSILPPSNARTAALTFMIIHQTIVFGLFIIPLYFMTEKLFGVHEGWYPKRAVARLPVAGFIWFMALLLPFFGPLNSIVGAMFMSFSTFMIPCAAFLYVFWGSQARQNAAEKTSKFLPRWKGIVALNLFIIAMIGTLGFGIGGYASIRDLVSLIKTFGAFDKCYQCPKKK